MNNKKKIALGAIGAGILGYGIGILTASKSGKETREDIKNTAQKTRKQIEKVLKNIHTEMTELMAEAKIIGLSYKGKAKEELEKMTANAIKARNKISIILSSLHEGESIDEDLDKAIKDAVKSIDHLKTFIEKENLSEKI